MRLPLEEQRKLTWRVSTLAPDFELLDVWRYPIEIEQSIPLDQFIDFIESSQHELMESRSLAGALFRLRGALGRILGWDGDPLTPTIPHPIPGCSETSLRDRLSSAERDDAAQSSQQGTPPAPGPGFKPVYRLESETLLEISNKTVHGLMHIGRVPISKTHWAPQMSVYVKVRGKLGRHYMTLISPFRHHIVYPTMMRFAKRGWSERGHGA